LSAVLESLSNGFALFEPPLTAQAAISEAVEVRKALELQVERLDRNLAALRAQLHDTRKRTGELHVDDKAVDPAATEIYMNDASWMPPVSAEKVPEERAPEPEQSSALHDLKKTLGRRLGASKQQQLEHLQLKFAQKSLSSHASRTDPVTVTVKHDVCWVSIEEYHDWTDAVAKAMAQFPGFLSFLAVEPEDGESTLFTNIFRFATVEHLSKYMASAERESFVKRLLPMLRSPDHFTASQQRFIPDALSDLYAPSQKVPQRPPAKWKIVVLTSWSLFCVVYPIGLYTGPLYSEYSLNPFLGCLVTAVVNVFLNTYVALPLINLIFGHWLRVPRRLPQTMDVVLRTLDQGLLSIWAQSVHVLLYVASQLALKYLYRG
jgi:antibiotic biosynthesis monooxygenase (ABM) superfamily enzyme